MRWRRHLPILAVLTVLLWYGATRNYLLFHSLVEFADITIYLFAAFLGVFASRMTPDPFLHGISVVYFSMALVTAVHTLAFEGMGVFPGWTANHPTQFWMLMRFIHGIGIPLTILLSSRPKFIRVFTAAAVVSVFGGILLIATGYFPDCFIPGEGLTPFKVGGEYAVALLLVASMLYSLAFRREEARRYGYAFEISLACFVASGMVFTLYTDVYGFFNMLGHILHGYGAYVLLFGFVVKSAQTLMDRHFHDLNEQIRAMNRELEDRVAQRTRELEEANSRLAADIARRKEVEEHLRKAKEDAEEANRAKSAFLATMSHEVRTPLNGILGMAAQLKDEGLKPEEREEYLSILVHSGESLLDILNNILDIARLESGRERTDRSAFRPAALVQEIVGLFAHRAAEKGIALTSSVDPNLPDVLLGYPMRLKQVLFNLIGNGIKFTDRGEVTLSLGCARRSGDDVLLAVAVKDTGIGISPKGIERIFTPFTQADDSISRRYGGTGLGLAISKRLVEFMGGRIDVASKVDEGSVFSFTLPLIATEEDSPAEAASGDTEALPLRGLSVLVAEDNSINRKVLEKILEKAGILSDSAENGAEAVKKGAGGGYDVILMDIEMPEMDGYEASRFIRRREKETGRRVPIIALSAHVSDEHRLKALEAGMDSFISKPVRKTDLLRALAEATRRGE